MKLSLLLSCGLCLLLSHTSLAVESVAKNKELRGLIEFPQFSAIWNQEFVPVPGYGFVLGDVNWQQEIERAKAEVAKDSEDPERLLKLAALYSKIEDYSSAESTYGKAESLLRAQLLKHPNNETQLLALAEALLGLHQGAKSKVVAEKAGKIDPKNWRYWRLRALYKQQDALTPTFGYGVASAGDVCKKIRKQAPTKKQLESALIRLNEAGTFIDKAVLTAPNEPGAYMARISWRHLDSILRTCANPETANPEDERSSANSTLFSEPVISDISRMAQLNPSDYRLPAAALTMELLARMKGVSFQSSNLRANMVLAQPFLKSEDPKIAALFSEIFGMVSFAQQDLADSEQWFRHAISLDPKRTASWDFLSGVLSKQKHWSELKTLCESRLRISESIFARNLMADAQWRLADKSGALTHARAAVKAAPDDLQANWRLGTMLMLDEASAPAEARDALDRAWTLSKNESQEDRANLALSRSIQRGLSGDTSGALQILDEADGLQLKSEKTKVLRTLLARN